MTRRILVGGVVLALIGCARVIPPAGGPEDLEPPKLLKSHPDSGALKVGTKGPFRLHFSEWVDPATVRSSISLVPAGTKAPEIKVDGGDVLVIPREPLDSPSTYVLRIQPGLADWRKAATKSLQEIPFATGDRIDSGRVRVQAWVGSDTTAPRPAKLRLGAWPMDTAARRNLSRLLRRKDSTSWLRQDPLPFREKPWRWVWSDSTGIADLRFLPEGRWRLFAWDDVDKDNFWRPGQEPLAWLGDVQGSGNAWNRSFLARLTIADTGAPASLPKDTARDSAAIARDSLRIKDSLALDSVARVWDKLPDDSVGVAVVAADSLPKEWVKSNLRMRLWPVFRRARARLSAAGQPRIRLVPGKWSGEVWIDRMEQGRPEPSDWRKKREQDPWCFVEPFEIDRQDSVRVRVQCKVAKPAADTGKASK